MANELLGDDFRIYWDTVGDFDTPTWEEELSMGDIGFDTGNEQVEIPLRIAFKTYKKGRADWTLTFTMNFDPTSTFHMAVRDAITTGDKIHMAITYGDIATTDYWHAWWFVSGPIGASLDSPATIEVEGKIHHDTGAAFAEIPAFVDQA